LQLIGGIKTYNIMTILTLLGIFAGSGLINFLVVAFVIIVIAYAIHLIMDALGAPPNWKKIVLLIYAVAVIVYLLNRFLGVNV
jgi:hypothetical protein